MSAEETAFRDAIARIQERHPDISLWELDIPADNDAGLPAGARVQIDATITPALGDIVACWSPPHVSEHPGWRLVRLGATIPPYLLGVVVTVLTDVPPVEAEGVTA